jgi:lipopolysaccharide transport protein LptA
LVISSISVVRLMGVRPVIAVCCCVIYRFWELLHSLGTIRMIHFSKPIAHISVVPGRRVAAILAGASLIAGSAVAQRPATTAEPIVINSVVANMDEANNTADFTTISITQGNTRLTADRASATGVGFQNSKWTFAGRVMINSETRGSLWADRAILEYRDGELAQVTATGSPAHFEQRRTDSQSAEHGQADEITYDAKQGTVRLQGHAHIVDGHSTEITAPMFVYHVRNHSLQAISESGAPAVHITTRPTRPLVTE